MTYNIYYRLFVHSLSLGKCCWCPEAKFHGTISVAQNERDIRFLWFFLSLFLVFLFLSCISPLRLSLECRLPTSVLLFTFLSFAALRLSASLLLFLISSFFLISPSSRCSRTHWRGKNLELVTYELWTLYRRRLSSIPQNGKINKVNYRVRWDSRRVRFCSFVRGFFLWFTWEKSSSNIYDVGV